jgi:hypothetical protein
MLYSAACIFALASAAATDTAVADRYAARAVGVLRQAIARQFRDTAHARSEGCGHAKRATARPRVACERHANRTRTHSLSRNGSALDRARNVSASMAWQMDDASRTTRRSEWPGGRQASDHSADSSTCSP